MDYASMDFYFFSLLLLSGCLDQASWFILLVWKFTYYKQSIEKMSSRTTTASLDFIEIFYERRWEKPCSRNIRYFSLLNGNRLLAAIKRGTMKKEVEGRGSSFGKILSLFHYTKLHPAPPSIYRLTPNDRKRYIRCAELPSTTSLCNPRTHHTDGSEAHADVDESS